MRLANAARFAQFGVIGATLTAEQLLPALGIVQPPAFYQDVRAKRVGIIAGAWFLGNMVSSRPYSAGVSAYAQVSVLSADVQSEANLQLKPSCSCRVSLVRSFAIYWAHVQCMTRPAQRCDLDIFAHLTHDHRR